MNVDKLASDKAQLALYNSYINRCDLAFSSYSLFHIGTCTACVCSTWDNVLITHLCSHVRPNERQPRPGWYNLNNILEYEFV